MKVLTESELRARLKNSNSKSFVVDSKVIVTPSAREYLKLKDIELVFEEQSKIKDDNSKLEEEKSKKFEPKYLCDYSGGYLEEKPENMTHLYGNKLVFKDHPNIAFRGKLDSLQSKILEVQVIAHRNKTHGLVKDLDETLDFVRNLLKSEVLNKEVEEVSFFGLDEDIIREMSHNPKTYLGVEHILPSHDMGEELIGLNSIRSNVREVELSSFLLKREDISKALNRLSSVLYVMMCRYLAGYYKK